LALGNPNQGFNRFLFFAGLGEMTKVIERTEPERCEVPDPASKEISIAGMGRRKAGYRRREKEWRSQLPLA